MKKRKLFLSVIASLAALLSLANVRETYDVTYWINYQNVCIQVTFNVDPCSPPGAIDCTFDFPFYGVQQLYTDSGCVNKAKRA